MSSFPFASYGLNDQPYSLSVQTLACGLTPLVHNIGAERLKGTYGTYTYNYPYHRLTPLEMQMIPKPAPQLFAYEGNPGSC